MLVWLLPLCCPLGMVVSCPSEVEVNQKRRTVPVESFQTGAAPGALMFDLIPASLSPVLASLLPLIYDITLTLERYLRGSCQQHSIKGGYLVFHILCSDTQCAGEDLWGDCHRTCCPERKCGVLVLLGNSMKVTQIISNTKIWLTNVNLAPQ